MVVAVAFDIGGSEVTSQHIRPDIEAMPDWVLGLMGWEGKDKLAAPEYPCLIDVNHVVAELYNMVNVPTAVWINEQGRIVRPPDSAGASDEFRKMDTTTFRMPPDAVSNARAGRKAYVTALRDWIENGSSSRYVLRDEAIREKLRPYNDDDALAAAYFRLGVELYKLGRKGEAQTWMAEAKRLRPESWSFKRQAWELEAVGKSAGPEFWRAVHELGEKRYYPLVEL